MAPLCRSCLHSSLATAEQWRRRHAAAATAAPLHGSTWARVQCRIKLQRSLLLPATYVLAQLRRAMANCAALRRRRRASVICPPDDLPTVKCCISHTNWMALWVRTPCYSSHQFSSLVLCAEVFRSCKDESSWLQLAGATKNSHIGNCRHWGISRVLGIIHELLMLLLKCFFDIEFMIFGFFDLLLDAYHHEWLTMQKAWAINL